MYWANLLHIYQPPKQKKEIIWKVAKESYLPILRILKQRPKAKISLNINGSLAEQLPGAGLRGIINDIKKLALKGQIEFTGSAKYHVILPLLPEKEIIRQIELNFKTNQKFFGQIYKPTGFFLPELCYSKRVAKIIKKLDFKWIVLDEIAYQGKVGQVKFDQKYILKNIGLPILFRTQRISNIFFTAEAKTVKDFMKIMRADGRVKNYLITALDGENLGHHRKGMDRLYAKLLDQPFIKTINFTELIGLYKKEKVIDPLPSSWSSREIELKRKIPYPLWQNPKNEIQKRQWQLTNLVIKTFYKISPKDKGWPIARQRLDRAFFSCQYWWASAMPWWSINMIREGAESQVKSILPLRTANQKTKNKIIDLSQKITFLAREWQESGRIDKIRKSYLANEEFERYFSGKIIK
jgi:alpha-amylase/alpha-mannosidase (GH57 family)